MTLDGKFTDLNAYEFGELNGHYIVIAYLPNGVYGTVSAASVFGLMVGIGGGVPSRRNDVRLGDVAVSKPGGKHVQGGQFETTGILNQPPQALLTHLSQLEAKQMTDDENKISEMISKVLEQNPHMKERFSRPEHHTDLLFNSSYHHTDEEHDCANCDKEQLVKRQPGGARTPYIHYGLIASGNQVMKDSETRDRLAKEHGILCFEMEAAGLMNELPTLQKQWQGYAALTAAVYAKLLLSVIPACYSSPNSLESKTVRHWIEITQLEELLTMQDGPSRTQVALELAYRIRDRDKECSVFWTFSSIGQTLGLHDVKPADVKEQIKLYLSSDRGGKWLLIFDNADDTEMWLATSDTAPALEDFIPKSEQGRILFTTRNRKLAMKLAPFNFILQKTLTRENQVKDNPTTASLLEQLAFLPLAITQASAYIIENSISLSAYLAILQTQEQDAVGLLSEDFEDLGRYRDIQNPHQNRLAAEYLSFMACINPRNIPQLDALGLLNAYSFTNIQDTNISMHRLVHIATRNWLRKNELFIFPDDHHTNRGLWREYLPHALAIMHEEDFIQNIADCLTSDGRYHEAEALYKELLEWNWERNGRKHPDSLNSMANLASTYRNQGRWNEAEKLEVQVIKTSKTALGPRHPDTLTSMANLASTYRNQGRWNEAEKLFVQVTEARKTVLGAEHPDTLASMNNLAHTWHSQQKILDALALMGECLMVQERVLGPSHPLSVSSSRSLRDWKEQATSMIDKQSKGPGQAESVHIAEEIHQRYSPAVVITTPPDKDEKHPVLLRSRGQSAIPIKQFLESHPLLIASRGNSPVLRCHDLQDVD
ncbi:hypothetical protein BDV12DRAFT_205678 [Aspergillus spectabilis]